MRVILEHPTFCLYSLFLCVPGSWFLKGQDRPFILAFLDLQFVYHKVKAYEQNPKQQKPIISQGNWLLIGNNNRTDWRWREKDRRRQKKREAEGLMKNDWSMSHSRDIWWTGIKTERGHSLPPLSLISSACLDSSLLPTSYYPYSKVYMLLTICTS